MVHVVLTRLASWSNEFTRETDAQAQVELGKRFN